MTSYAHSVTRPPQRQHAGVALVKVLRPLITSTKFQLKLRVAPGSQRREVVVQGAKLVQLFQCLLLLNGDLMLSRVVALHSGQFADDFAGGMSLRSLRSLLVQVQWHFMLCSLGVGG